MSSWPDPSSMPLGPEVPAGVGVTGSASTSSISPIGVMPNTGSRLKDQPVDSAPISFPST